MEAGAQGASPPPLLPGASPDLLETMRRIDRAGWAAEAYDAEWRLVWISEDLKAILGEFDREKLGYGLHFVETRGLPTWSESVTEATRTTVLAELLPYVLADTPGGRGAIARMLGVEEAELGNLEPVTPPGLWAWSFEFVQRGLPPADGYAIALQGRDVDGRLIGTVMLYAPGLPASVLVLVSRGDRGMFERMARLLEPGRRQAAVLFADLEASGPLSRRLASGAYFKLIRSFTTAIDAAVIAHLGIVGKHVGDGVSAFFIAEELGSASGAARAALEAAREIAGAAERAAAEVAGATGALDPAECRVNVGVHWGGALYMGQLVTGGRLEVTALGDEVNECARLQEAAQDGQVLASKALVEQLSAADAAALGLDPDAAAYTPVAELPGAGDKARRDAGTVPVTAI